MQTIETSRLMLRSLLKDDAERIERLAGEYDVAKTTLNIPHPYPKGAANDFIAHSIQVMTDGKTYTYAIIERQSDKLIGVIGLRLEEAHKRGELGYWIGRTYWNKGYGTEAAKAVLTFGFETLHLNKIYACAMTKNPGSSRIMEKVGMTHEGIFKQHMIRNGQYEDITYYGILKKEFI